MKATIIAQVATTMAMAAAGPSPFNCKLRI
jgi:hypothetical protein